MNIDIVIHPTFAQEYMKKHLNSQTIWQQYLDDLISTVSGNECVVLLKSEWNKELNDFEKKINPDYVFNTASDYFTFPGTRGEGMREDTGFVVDKELEQLSIIVNSGDEKNIKIHGSYWGYCLSEFVLQLYFISVLKKEFTLNEYKHNFYLTGDIEEIKKTNIRKYFPKMPENVKGGSVFLNPYQEVMLYSPNTVDKSKEINFPFGSVEYQLLSLESRLYAVKMSKEQQQIVLQRGAKIELANS